MINIRSVSTLGIGFGIAAISVIGLVSEAPTQPYSLLGSGGGSMPYQRPAPAPKKKTKKTFKIPVVVKSQSEIIKVDIPLHFDENAEEETIIVFLLSELFRRDLI